MGNVTDNRRKLYNAVSKDYSDIGSWEEFNRKMDNEANRKKLYATVRNGYSDIGSWDDFNARMYQTPAPRQVSSQRTTTPQASAPRTAPHKVAASPQMTAPKPAPYKSMADFVAQNTSGTSGVSSNGLIAKSREGALKAVHGDRYLAPVNAMESPQERKIREDAMRYDPQKEFLHKNEAKTEHIMRRSKTKTGQQLEFLEMKERNGGGLSQQEQEMANALRAVEMDDIQRDIEEKTAKDAGKIRNQQRYSKKSLAHSDLAQNGDPVEDGIDPATGKKRYILPDGTVTTNEGAVALARNNALQARIAEEEAKNIEDRMEEITEQLKELHAERDKRRSQKNRFPRPANALDVPASQMGAYEEYPEDKRIEELQAEYLNLSRTKELRSRDLEHSGFWKNFGYGALDAVMDPGGIMSVSAGATTARSDNSRLLESGAMRAEEETKLGFAYGTGNLIGSVVADPVFGISGFGGKVGSSLLKTAARKGVTMKLAAKGANAATRKAVEGAVGRGLSKAPAIAETVGGGVANIATFEGLNSAREQLRTNGCVSVGETAKSAARGAMLGATMSVFGLGVGNVANRMMKSAEGTGTHFAIKGGQVGVSVVGEGTIFAAPHLIENAMLDDSDPNKRDWMDIWGESVLTVAALKGSHLPKKMLTAPQRIAAVRQQAVRENKSFLDIVADNMSRNPSVSLFNKDEVGELKGAGYEKLKDLLEHKDIESDVKSENPLEGFETMEKLIKDNRVSQATRAKAYYMLTGKMLPMNMVVGHSVEKTDNGTWWVRSHDMKGGVVTARRFKSERDAQNEIARINYQADLNGVAVGEAYKESAASEKELDLAIKDVCEENGYLPEPLNKLWEKSEKGEKLSEGESGITRKIKDALETYEGIYNPERPTEIRKRIEEKHDVDIEKALSKYDAARNDKERAALSEYFEELFPEELRKEAAAEAEADVAQVVADQERLPMRKPVGRAVMRYDGREVEVLSGRVVMTDDGTMVDKVRSDKTVVIRDPATGKPEMVAPEAIGSYEEIIDGADGVDGADMADPSAAASAQSERVESEPKPVGKGVFGEIYDSFKGKAKDAVRWLFGKKSGEAKGVFHRDEVGDIGLIWGDDRGGLQHIIEKHVIEHSDYNSVEELTSAIEDVVSNGDFIIQKGGNLRFEKGGHRVIVAKNQEGDFVVTAYDNSRSLSEKKRTEADATLFRQRVLEEMNGTPVSPSSGYNGEVNASPSNKQAYSEAAAIPFGVNDSFRVGVSGREESQPATVIDREGENVIVWSPSPIVEGSKRGKTMPGYVSEISRADLEQLLERDAEGNPVDYAPGETDEANGANETDMAAADGTTRSGDGDSRTVETVVPNLEDRGTGEMAMPAVEAEEQGEEPTLQSQEDTAPVEADDTEGSALDRIPVDENGKHDFGAVDADTAWDGLVEKYEGNTDRAQGFSANMVKIKEAALKKAEKAKSKPTEDPDEWDAAERAREDAVEQARRDLEHWRSVAGVEQRRQQTMRAEQEAEAKERERIEMEERKAIARGDKELRDAYDAVKDYPEAVDMLRDLSPRTLDEAAAFVLSTNKVLLSDDGVRRGARAEVGIGEVERRRLFPMFARRENGGESIARLAEDKMQSVCEEYGIPYDVQSARDALIEMLHSSERPSDIRGYIRNRRIEDAREYARRMDEQIEAGAVMSFMEEMHMTPDEYDTWREVAEAEAEEALKNLDEQEYNSNIADEYARWQQAITSENRIDNETDRRDRGDESAGEGTPDGAVREMVSGERVHSTARAEESSAHAGRSEETGREMRGNGEHVPGEVPAGASDRTAAGRGVDDNGHPFVVSEDGTTVFGRITEDTGLAEAPIKLSEGVVDENGNGYGLLHMEYRHGEEIRRAGFKSVEEFVSYVAKNYDPDNIKVGKRRVNGNGTFIIQIEDDHSNLLYIELSKDGSYWNVNSGGIFRKGYAEKKKNVESNTEHPTSDTASSDKSFVQTGSTEGSKPADTHSNNQRLSERKVNDSAPDKQTTAAESFAQSSDREGEKSVQGAAGDSRGVGNFGNGRESKTATHEEKLTKEAASGIIAEMEHRAKVAPELELTIENWDAQFGKNGIVNTPIGEVKMGENQFTKLMRQGRNGKLGMIKPTLENPDIIIEDASVAKDANATERESSYVFVKTFVKPDGSRYYYFTSVTVSKNGHEVVVSNQEKRRNVLTNLLMKGKLVWKHADDVSTASDVADGLYSSQGNMSDPASEGTDAPQTNNVLFERKVNDSASDKQAAAAESFAQSSDREGEKSVQGAVEAASAEVNTDPTEAQKKAGNYKMGHVRIGDFDITIENPAGSVRSGKDADGKEWRTTMANAYGYIRGTESVDGDPLDVFLHSDMDQWNGRKVFVVDQTNTDGSFDEHKVMLGFNDKEEAMAAYLANYDNTWANTHPGLRISETNIEDFNKWVQSSHRKTKPFADYTTVSKIVDEAPTAARADGADMSDSKLSGRRTDTQKLSSRVEPTGIGDFGPVFTQFRGKVNEAVALLMSEKGGDILGVFSRRGVGDIDFVWGDKNGGFAHILDKHVGAGKSFATAEEAAREIDRIIKHGSIAFENGDKIVFRDGAKLVTVRKNLRSRGKKIADKNWVLTAYDDSGADNASAISKVDSIQAAPTDTPESGNKGNALESDRQAIIDKSSDTKGDKPKRFDISTERSINAAAYEAAKGLLESAGIPVVEVSGMEAQQMIGQSGEDVQLMGSRTDRKMEKIAENYAGKELDENQQAAVDVFSGKRDNVAIEVERADGKKRVVMRQGKEPKAGAKHSLFRHFETSSNYITAEDIAIIPEIIAKGERIKDGNRIAYVYVAKDGSRLKVTTKLTDRREEFTNLLSNRKPLKSELVKNTQLSARASDSEVSDAKIVEKFQIGKPKLLKTPSGTVYGWTVGGKVYLNRDAMDPETPLHEYTHLWDEMVQQENPELWARGKKLMKQTPVWQEVLDDPNYSDIRDDEDAVASEVHSRLTGERGKKRIEEMMSEALSEEDYVEKAKKVSLIQELKDWLSDMFKSLKQTLGKWSKQDLDNLTADDFADMTLRDLAEGMNPRTEMRRGEQMRTVTRENPMLDDYHTGIRSREDVKSFDEILKEAESAHKEFGSLTYPDMDIDMLREAGRTGMITVYSSKPIEPGNFVTPSRMNAEDYSGGGKIYTKRVPVGDVAWISEDEGQYAPVKENRDGKARMMAKRSRRRLSVTGRSLFDWADSESESQRLGKAQSEDGIAAVEADEALDSYAQAYSDYLDNLEAMESQLESGDDALGGELAERMEKEESELAEQRDRLREKLRDFYIRNNSPEDTANIVRDMVARVQAEVEIRHRKDLIIGDLLYSAAAKDEAAEKNDEATRADMADKAKDTDNAETGKGTVKTAGGTISYEAQGHLPDAKEGEFAYVERQFSRTGEFSFTGQDRIKDRGDVAYLFRSLEDYSVENVFAVLVKDGKGKVLHIGMGTTKMSVADMGAIRAGYDAFGADKIYLVHNHPSGNLRASEPDRRLMQMLETAFEGKAETEGIIIDTTSGRYLTFDGKRGSQEYDRRQTGESASEAEVYHFNKADRSGMPSTLTSVRGAEDVKSYLENLRFGDGTKTGYLILSNSNHIIGNFHTDYSDMADSGLAEEIASVASKYGGSSVIVYGNMGFSGISALRSSINDKSLGSIRLLDVVGVRGGVRESAMDAGMLSEDAAPYGSASVHEPMVSTRGRGEFKAMRDRAVAERGLVMPGLNDASVRIVEVPRHDFTGTGKEALKAAEKWAKENIVGMHQATDSRGDSFEYSISNDAVEKYVSKSATGKSENIGVHLAALKKLPEIIGESVEAEVHPDYKKLNGTRSAKSEINSESLVHRFYGAAKIDGLIHRVKTTIREYVDSNRLPLAHSYEITEIELLEAPSDGVVINSGEPLAMTSDSSISTAKLLQGVEKSYDPGKKLLEESVKADTMTESSPAKNGRTQYGLRYREEGGDFRMREGAEEPLAETASRPGGTIERKADATSIEAKGAHAAEMAQRLNTPIRVVRDVAELTNSDPRIQIQMRSSRGFYDPVSGEVVIVLPNHADVEDVAETVFHEVVGHKGLRELIGEENYDAFCDEVYAHLKDELKSEVDRETTHRFLQEPEKGYEHARRVAVDELFGRMAEKGFEDFTKAERGVWAKLKAKVLEAINRFLGSLKLPKWVRLGDNELRYMLWKSRERLRTKGDLVDKARDAAKRDELGLNKSDVIRESKRTESIDEINNRFNEQIDHWESGEMAGKDFIEAGRPMGVMRQFMPDGTITLRQKVLTKSRKKHGLTAEDIKGLPGALARPIFVFKSTPETISVLTELKSATGQNLFVAVEIGVNKQFGHRTLEVNDILTIHGREAENIILPIVDNNTLVWADKEKGLEWLSSAKSNSQAIAAQTLDDAAKVVKSFENPTIREEINTKKGVSQRVLSLMKSEHLTSVTDGATLLESAKLPKFFEDTTNGGEEKVEYRFRESETGDIWKDGSLGMEEKITSAVLRLSQKQSGDLALRNEAMQAIGGNLSALRKAMSAQKRYDQSTAKRVSDLARILMQSGQMSDLTSGEVQRLVSAVKNAVGSKDAASVETVMDIMIGNQLRNGKSALQKLLSIRGSKVDARGVEVQGALDVDGQRMIKVVKGTMSLSEDEILKEMDDAMDRMGDPDRTIADDAAIRYGSLRFALDYVQNVKGSEAEEKSLRKELENAKQEKDAGRMKDDAYRQFVEATEDAIRKNKIERAEAYFNLVGRLSDTLRESVANARAFREAEKARVNEIHHNANSDMEGRELRGQRGITRLEKLNNNPLIRLALGPLVNLDQMLRLFGEKNPDGRGYLYNHFMRGYIDSADKEQLLIEKYYNLLDKKAAEIFGKRKLAISGRIISVPYKYLDIYEYAESLPKSRVSYYDGGGMREYDLSQSQLLYLYAVEKMALGKATNRRMGITYEVMEKIEESLDAKLKAYADWVQEELLPEFGEEMNAVHIKIFGADMDDIEHYFTFIRDKNALSRTVENGEPEKQNRISMTTGAIKKRTANVVIWDIPKCNFFDVTAHHIKENCHWMSFAELNRDFGTLLSYNHFKQQVMNMNTIYGSGKDLWETFCKCCAIATDSYEAKTTDMDQKILKIAKNIATSKIAFNPMPALKQLLSLPAFAGEVDMKYIAKDLATFGIPAVKWAWENMPNYRKRVKSRTMGDYYLSNTSADENRSWLDELQKQMSKGMYPNIGVDAWTIAVGSHGAYLTAKEKYLRQGYAEEKAERRAIQDAEICFNKSQQSSEGPFMAPVQIDRTVAGATMMLYRNSSTSYSRENVAATRNLKRIITGKVDVDFMTKQLLRSAEIPTYSERFDTELQQQIEGKLKEGHIYSLGKPGGILQSAGFPEAPIEMSSTRLAEKASQSNHPFPIQAVKGLVKALNQPIAVFRYGNNAMNVIIGLNYQGKQFLVGVHFNQERGGAEVSSVRGLFPKDNAEWLNWITQGKATYLNHKKIQAIIDQQRINLADVEYLDLEDVAKIINNFENPDIPEQKKMSEWREEDVKRARKHAKRELRSSIIRNFVNVNMFSWILPWLWRIGGVAPLLLLGSDDDREKAVEDANRYILFSFMEGFGYGDVAADLIVTGIRKWQGDEDARWSNVGRNHPLLGDISMIKRHMDSDAVEACNDIINILASMVTGANPQMIANWTAAFMDKCGGDRAMSNEWALFVARLINTPQSQLDKIYFKEVGLNGAEAIKLTPDELAQRFAIYKVRRGYLFTPWEWNNEKFLQKRKNIAKKSLKEKLKGQSEAGVNESLEAYDAEYTETGKRFKEIKHEPDSLRRAVGLANLYDSPEWKRYKLYEKLHGKLDNMIKSWLSAPDAESAAVEAESVIEYKGKIVEMLDSWEDESRSGELRKEAIGLVRDWEKREHERKVSQ